MTLMDERALRLADELVADGSIRSAVWRDALLATPRHAFLPRFYEPGHNVMRLVTSDDADWLDVVYSNEPLVTQFNGDPEAIEGIPTSSSTAPDLMFSMLEALDVQDGHRVLEIGTGTGYNAALLCHRLGDKNVTTVDVDERLTVQAAERLAGVGLHPTVIATDGTQGYEDSAPYDRIIATCAVRRIPAAWLQQVRPGGFILACLETSLHGYGLARITLDEHGCGHGGILKQDASFMPMRSHADPMFSVLAAKAEPAEPGEFRSGITLADLDSDDARFILGLALPEVASFGVRVEQDGLYLAHHENGSWAELRADGSVVRGGPADLWQVLEHAYDEWVAAGRPARHEVDMTVTSDVQVLQLRGRRLSWRI